LQAIPNDFLKIILELENSLIQARTSRRTYIQWIGTGDFRREQATLTFQKKLKYRHKLESIERNQKEKENPPSDN
jgi:hypothetical protein